MFTLGKADPSGPHNAREAYLAFVFLQASTAMGLEMVEKECWFSYYSFDETGDCWLCDSQVYFNQNSEYLQTSNRWYYNWIPINI